MKNSYKYSISLCFGEVNYFGVMDIKEYSNRKMKENLQSASDCRKRAEMYFDKDKCFERYIKLYEK